MPRARRRHVPARKHDWRGRTEVAELEVGLPEKALCLDRGRRRGKQTAAAEPNRAARQRHGCARGPRDAGPLASARRGGLRQLTLKGAASGATECLLSRWHSCNKDRIAEFVRSIAIRVQFLVGAKELRVVGERTQ